MPTVAADDVETDRAVVFCGAIIHQPHHAVRQQISKLFSEVYVSARTRGSPAYQYGLAPTNFITHVNGKPDGVMRLVNNGTAENYRPIGLNIVGRDSR